MPYCVEQDVYDATGFNRVTIQTVGALSSADALALVERFIANAEKEVNDIIRVPITIHREYHEGTGETNEWDLGSEDETAFYTDYVSKNCVVDAYACYFGTKRHKVPYPKDADMCEKSSKFAVSGATISQTDGEALTVDGAAEDTYVTVADTTGFEEGDYVRIEDTASYEYNQIDDVPSAIILNLVNPLQNAYTMVANAKVVGPIISGERTMHITYAGVGYVRYPSTQDLNRNIDIYDFVSLRIRSSSSARTFTLRLYDKDGVNYNYVAFTVDKTNVWYIKHFDLEEDFTGAIDWDDINLYHWELHSDGACVIDLDNLNFNDSWFVTVPQGKFCIAHDMDEDPPSDGYPFFVTYSLNPFVISTPYNIKEATAKIAGAKLLSWLIGVRERDTAFLVQGNTMIPVPDRETMNAAWMRLNAEAKELLAEYGFGWEFEPVRV